MTDWFALGRSILLGGFDYKLDDPDDETLGPEPQDSDGMCKGCGVEPPAEDGLCEVCLAWRAIESMEDELAWHAIESMEETDGNE